MIGCRFNQPELTGVRFNHKNRAMNPALGLFQNIGLVLIVIPAQAGIQRVENWIPACAGMTNFCSKL
jgi:hypothetical protein